MKVYQATKPSMLHCTFKIDILKIYITRNINWVYVQRKECCRQSRHLLESTALPVWPGGCPWAWPVTGVPDDSSPAPRGVAAPTTWWCPSQHVGCQSGPSPATAAPEPTSAPGRTEGGLRKSPHNQCVKVMSARTPGGYQKMAQAFKTFAAMSFTTHTSYLWAWILNTCI